MTDNFWTNAMPKRPNLPRDAAELRRHAEARLRTRQSKQQSEVGDPKSEADPRRLFHELQVHQVELEMQNAELQDARDRMEALLEKYTDLYDFAPVGYFSVDEQGRILEVNLTGAALLGVERSLLSQPALAAFCGSGEPAGLSGLPGTSLRRDRETGLRGGTIKSGRRAFLGRLSRLLRHLRQRPAEMVPGGDVGHHVPQAGGGGASPHGGSGGGEPGVAAGD